jgi:hypothetical protein
MRFLNRLRLRQKLGVLVVAMPVPTCALGTFYLRGADAEVSLTVDAECRLPGYT